MTTATDAHAEQRKVCQEHGHEFVRLGVVVVNNAKVFEYGCLRCGQTRNSAQAFGAKDRIVE